MNERADAVENAIRLAFVETPYPGNQNLVVDQSGHNPECADVEREFKGKAWSDVSVDIVRRRAESLPLLTPAAFRYYLPAFMLAVIHHYYSVDVVRDSVLFNLTPPAPSEGWEWDFFRTRAEQFTNGEKDAIAMFLGLIDEYYRADWQSAGIEPQADHVVCALRFWTTHTESSS